MVVIAVSAVNTKVGIQRRKVVCSVILACDSRCAVGILIFAVDFTIAETGDFKIFVTLLIDYDDTILILFGMANNSDPLPNIVVFVTAHQRRCATDLDDSAAISIDEIGDTTLDSSVGVSEIRTLACLSVGCSDICLPSCIWQVEDYYIEDTGPETSSNVPRCFDYVGIDVFFSSVQVGRAVCTRRPLVSLDVDSGLVLVNVQYAVTGVDPISCNS
jgi:hypothetical protein